MRSVPLLLAMLCWLALGHPTKAAAETWTTDALVGINEVAFTIDITCPAMTFVCSVVDGYSDTQLSQMTGSGGLFIDGAAEQIQFESDGTQDVGSGPQPAYFSLSGSSMSFASIIFAGVPEIEDLLVFSLSNAPIDVAGLSLFAPGDYPFSTSLSQAATANVVGDLELSMPDIVVPAQVVAVSGVMRVLGDVDLDQRVEYEIRNVTASLALQMPGLIGGEPVDIDVTASLTANLSGDVAGPIVVPGLGGAGTIALAIILLATQSLSTRRQVAQVSVG